MLTNLPKLEVAVGKADPAKLKAKLEEYTKALQLVETEANKEDGISPEEQRDINFIRDAIEGIKQKLDKLSDEDISTDNIESDSIIDNLENAEGVEDEMITDGKELEDLSQESADLGKKNRRRLGRIQKRLVKLKDQIVAARIQHQYSVLFRPYSNE